MGLQTGGSNEGAPLVTSLELRDVGEEQPATQAAGTATQKNREEFGPPLSLQSVFLAKLIADQETLGGKSH